MIIEVELVYELFNSYVIGFLNPINGLTAGYNNPENIVSI